MLVEPSLCLYERDPRNCVNVIFWRCILSRLTIETLELSCYLDQGQPQEPQQPQEEGKTEPEEPQAPSQPQEPQAPPQQQPSPPVQPPPQQPKKPLQPRPPTRERPQGRQVEDETPVVEGTRTGRQGCSNRQSRVFVQTTKFCLVKKLHIHWLIPGHLLQWKLLCDKSMCCLNPQSNTG